MAIQATLEQQIAQLARDNDLAWVEIKALRGQIEALAAIVQSLNTDVETLRTQQHALGAEPKRGPGRPRKSQPESGGPVLGGHEPTP